MESRCNGGEIRPSRWFAGHTLAFLLMLLLALVRYAPTPARGPDTASDEFSAGRVRNLLEKIIRPGVPHPVGSLDHTRVRDAIIAEFRVLGLEPEVQAPPPPSWVQNIVVHLRGTEGMGAVALVAHYDSVPAGPGVADDASGVCSILEIARILTEGPPPRNDMIFLITDAEEVGLYGAEAFAAEHPLMDKIDVVLNWEARGNRGPSFMFETGPDNLGLIRLMTQHCRRTISTSLFPSIYKVLPNDTDLTVFKKRGVRGMNFAFIGGVQHYHRPSDNLENLDLGSVQHQGEHFLAMAQALSDAQLSDLPKGDAVFFDVFGWFTLSWPQRWNLAFAVVVALLALVLVAASLREAEKPLRDFLLALFGCPLALIAAALLGAGACWLVIKGAGEPVPWWAWPQPIWLTTWCIGVGTPALVWTLIRNRTSGQVSSSVIVMVWALLGLLTAWLLPGASYLFTVPAGVACVIGLVCLWRGFRWEAANLAFLAAACVLWLPVARGMVDAFGFYLSLVHTIPLTLIGLLIVPTITPDTRICRLLLAVLGVALTALVAAMLVPAYTEQWPQPASIHCEQEDGEAILSVECTGQLPESMRQAIAGPPQEELPGYVAWNIPADLAAPTVEIVEEQAVASGRRLKLRVKPAQGQYSVIVAGDPNLGLDVTLNGQPVSDSLQALPLCFSEASEAEIELTAPGTLKLVLLGFSRGVPPFAEPLRKARPAWAAPKGRGDYTQVTMRIEL